MSCLLARYIGFSYKQGDIFAKRGLQSWDYAKVNESDDSSCFLSECYSQSTL